MSTEVAKKQGSQSERFTNMVMKEFSDNAGDLSITSFQRKLIQNYFIKLDATLKEAERKRMLKRESDRDLTPVTWENVNMQGLATDVIAFSSVGLDPAQKNHINIIPFKNNGTSKYDITFIMGYRGIELKAVKYGLDVPDDVTVELVYKNDAFIAYKKSRINRIETYDFDIKDPFERGAIIGGFYYHFYREMPEKNKLEIFSLNDILKRRPKYASAEFWGGTKDKWKDGKKVGTEEVEGWYDEMCWKTIYRAAYDDITIDSEKIDEHFLKVIEIERGGDSVSEKVNGEVASKAHKKEMTFEDANIVDNKQLTAGDDTIGSQQPSVNEEEPGY